jgi:hypothetical protein
MAPESLNFSDYQQALERLRHRAHARRAVMTRGLATSVEMPILDEQEMRDRDLCQQWQLHHGFASDGF